MEMESGVNWGIRSIKEKEAGEGRVSSKYEDLKSLCCPLEKSLWVETA